MIEVEITGVPETVERIQDVGDKMRIELRAEVLAQALNVQSHTVRDKLSGDPLHRRTALLANSINTEMLEDEETITGRVGTNVRYARPNEFGGTFEIPAHTRRLTEVFGRQVSGDREVLVRAHTATYPERSFLRSTLRDLEGEIRDAFAQAAVRAAGLA